MKRLRLGIIGTGGIAKAHAYAVKNCENAQLVAVHDVVAERAEAFAKEHNCEAESDFAHFLGRSDIDAVTIATPSGTHLDCAVPAAQAGKHILCEKPLDVTVEKIDRIIEACDANKVTLACVFQNRTNQNIQGIRKALAAGRFGKLLLVSFQAKWYRSQEYYDSAAWRGTRELDGGGALMNQAVHFVDILCYLAGRAKSVYAFTDTMTHKNIEVEDNAVACVRFANGAMGTIEASTSCAPGFPRRLAVSGDRGSVVMVDDELTRWEFLDKADEDEKILAEGAAGDQLKGGHSDPLAIGFEGHRRQVQDFVDAVLEGREPFVPGREGRLAVELICGIYESSRTGKLVTFSGD